MTVKDLLETVPGDYEIRIADKWKMLGTLYKGIIYAIDKRAEYMNKNVYCVYPEDSKLNIIVE